MSLLKLRVTNAPSLFQRTLALWGVSFGILTITPTHFSHALSSMHDGAHLTKSPTFIALLPTALHHIIVTVLTATVQCLVAIHFFFLLAHHHSSARREVFFYWTTTQDDTREYHEK
tara:strand:- start:2295 stop:2642 length:348 start_codon:yes stop_codon:yes gene_type:complete